MDEHTTTCFGYDRCPTVDCLDPENPHCPWGYLPPYMDSEEVNAKMTIFYFKTNKERLK